MNRFKHFHVHIIFGIIIQSVFHHANFNCLLDAPIPIQSSLLGLNKSVSNRSQALIALEASILVTHSGILANSPTVVGIFGKYRTLSSVFFSSYLSVLRSMGLSDLRFWLVDLGW